MASINLGTVSVGSFSETPEIQNRGRSENLDYSKIQWFENKQISLDQVAELAGFDPVTPSYLPDGLQLVKVTLHTYPGSGKAFQLYLGYTNPSAGNNLTEGINLFESTIQDVEDTYVMSSYVKRISIGGRTAAQFGHIVSPTISKSGTSIERPVSIVNASTIMWEQDGLLLRLDAYGLADKVVIRVAESVE